MTVESDLYTALKGLVTSRCFPDIAPLGTVRPYITFTQIGGEALAYTENTVPDAKNGRFQVDVWADSRTTASLIALQIEAALITATAFQARPVGAPQGRYEADSNLYGSMQDFSIWSTR